jgi:hypothetical protein
MWPPLSTRRAGGPRFRGSSPQKAALLTRLRSLARQLERPSTVDRATVYRAILVAPPTGCAKQQAAHVAPLPETRWRRRQDPAGPVLFNYFVADDAAVALQLCDYLAGWYAVETGMDNSTVLEPTGQIQGTRPVDERVKPSPRPHRWNTWWPQLEPTGRMQGTEPVGVWVRPSPLPGYAPGSRVTAAAQAEARPSSISWASDEFVTAGSSYLCDAAVGAALRGKETA